MTFFNKKEIESFIADRKAMSKEQQVEQAHSVLNEIQQVDVKKAYRQVEDRISHKKPLRIVYEHFSKIAAILIIPLIIITLWSLFFNPHTQVNRNYSIQKVFNPSGIRSNVVLPDGSKVCLNAESSLEYRIPFSSDCRKITLNGEAFFDVKKDPRHPFIVQSGDVKVTVLGTRFNFKAYQDENNIEVVLERGKIQLNTLWQKHNDEIIMKPGDWAVVDKNRLQASLSKGNIEKLTAWRTGKLIFDNSSMTEVVRTLERWYGVDIKIMDNSIMQYRITTTFENEPLKDVLELLCLSSPIKYTQSKVPDTTPNQTFKETQIKIYKRTK